MREITYWLKWLLRFVFSSVFNQICWRFRILLFRSKCKHENCEEKGIGFMKLKWTKRIAFLHISNKSIHLQHNNDKSCCVTWHVNPVSLFEWIFEHLVIDMQMHLRVQCSHCEFSIDEIVLPFVEFGFSSFFSMKHLSFKAFQPPFKFFGFYFHQQYFSGLNMSVGDVCWI